MVDRERRTLLKVTPVAALALAGCSGGGGDASGSTSSATSASTTSTSSESSSSTRTSTTASVTIGEAVRGDKMSMVVRSLSKTDSLSEFQTADAGNTYAVVELAVKNETQNAFANFSSFLQTKLKDASGYAYTPELNVSDSAFQGGQLAPGEVARGDVAFEVPTDASGLTLQFDFSAFSFTDLNRVTVDLTRTADTVADLRQSLHVPIHAVGDAVTHDGVTVTVNSVDYETSMGSYTKAPSGHEYAIVDVTTANGTNDSVAFSSLLQMATKDGSGRSFSYSAAASSQLTRDYSGGEVSSGDSVRGKVAYEVPTDDSPLYFTFEYSVITGGSKTFWKLR